MGSSAAPMVIFELIFWFRVSKYAFGPKHMENFTHRPSLEGKHVTHYISFFGRYFYSNWFLWIRFSFLPLFWSMKSSIFWIFYLFQRPVEGLKTLIFCTKLHVPLYSTTWTVYFFLFRNMHNFYFTKSLVSNLESFPLTTFQFTILYVSTILYHEGQILLCLDLNWRHRTGARCSERAGGRKTRTSCCASWIFRTTCNRRRH